VAAGDRAAIGAAAGDFRRYGSARRLYNFTPDDIDAEVAAAARAPVAA